MKKKVLSLTALTAASLMANATTVGVHYSGDAANSFWKGLQAATWGIIQGIYYYATH